MFAKGKAYEPLRLVGQREHLFTEPYRNNAVPFAMHDKERRLDASDAFIRAEGVLDEPADRYERISGSADVDRGGERRIEDQPTDLPLGGERNGDSGAKRLAPEDDPAWRNARHRKIVGRHCVQQQAALGGRPCRTAIAAIGKPEQSEPVRGQPPETAGAQIERAAIALKINDQWFCSLRSRVPGDQAFAVGALEDHLLRMR